MITIASCPKLKLDSGIYAIAGISKNCGKTSFLNWLSTQLENIKLGILTTGRDGETTDLVYGNSKPSVNLSANTIFSTTSDSIEKLGSAIEILYKLPFQAGTKSLWLLKALRDIETEIVGPANAESQIKVAELMQDYGADLVLIDGSIDRKSIALSNKIKGVFLVIGGSYGAIDKIYSELYKLSQLTLINHFNNESQKLNERYVSYYKDKTWHETEYNSLLGNEQSIIDLIYQVNPIKLYISGAITDTILHKINPALKQIKSVIIRHPLQMHLTNANQKLFLASNDVLALSIFKITAVVVNSWSVKGNHLDSKKLRFEIRKMLPTLPVIDICEA